MRIQVGINNSVIVTVTELTTISNPYYLFVFSGNQTSTNYGIRHHSDNLSTDKTRYDKFEDFFALASNVGTYKYEIYQQTSATNTDIKLTQGLIEVGICEVFDDSDSTDKVYGANYSNVEFNG